MSQFAFNPQTTFANALILGDVGDQAVSPDLRQIIAANQTRDAVKELRDISVAGLAAQATGVRLQQHTNQQLRQANRTMSEVASGIGELASGVSGLREELSGTTARLDSMGNELVGMRDDLVTGISHLDLNLRCGFESVVKGLVYADHNAAVRFALETALSQHHHVETQSTLIKGFGFLADVSERQTVEIASSVENAAVQISSAIEQAADRIVDT